MLTRDIWEFNAKLLKKYMRGLKYFTYFSYHFPSLSFENISLINKDSFNCYFRI